MKALIALSAILGTTSALATPALHHPRAQPRPAKYKLSRTPPSFLGNAAPGIKSVANSFAVAAVSSDSSDSSSGFSGVAGAPESVKGGAILSLANTAFVTATFVVPAASMPVRGPTADNQNGLYQSSYWVGIDGVSPTCGASLRAGVDTFWDMGLETYAAWYEWYPAPSVDFGNFTVRPGDVVRISARAGTNGTSGRVTIEKLSKKRGGKVVASAVQSWAGQTGSSSKLCLAEAAWTVEDYALENHPDIPIAFANFTAVSFEQLEARDAYGKKGNLKAVKVFDVNLEAQGGQLTDCVAKNGGNTVRCKRVVGGV